MTTDVDEAREALLAGIVDDESGMGTFDDALVDALIAAVRAEDGESSPFPVAIPADRPYPITVTVTDASGSVVGSVTATDERAYRDALLILGSAVLPATPAEGERT